MIEIQGFRNNGDYIEISSSWWVNLDNGLYRIDQEKDINHQNNYQQTKNLIIKKGSIVEKVTKFPRETSHYQHESGDTLTSEEVLVIRRKYLGDVCYENDYPDLETEYKHKKELLILEDYKPVYTQKEDEYEVVELTCVGSAEDTGSDFITTALCYGKASFGNSGFYKVDLSRIAANELMGFVIKNELEASFENATHSNVHYAKIKGNYIMTSFDESREKKFRYATSLGAAKLLESDLRSKIRNHLSVKVFGDGGVLKEDSLKEIVSNLEKFSRTLGDVQSKQKTQVKYTHLMSEMSKYINEVKSLYEEG